MSVRVKSSVIAAVGLVTGILAGCAATETISSVSNPFSDYSLHLVDNGGSAKLAWGRPNSDAVGLMMECQKGSGHVEISDVARGRDRLLSLSAGGKRSDFHGTVEEGPGPALVYTTARTSSPALQGFRETGKVEVATKSAHYTVMAEPGKEEDVETFFKACGDA